MLAVAFFAAPAMADGCDKGACCDPCCEKLNSIEGAMTFADFPANLNFDFVKQGDQEAWTFGFAGANPIAKNAFNLEKDQVAGAEFNQGKMKHQEQMTDGAVALLGREDDNDLKSTLVANIEIIQSGNQVARAFGAGIADNQVTIKTSQSPCTC